MLQRHLELTKNYSLFLFGARGVGKSTLVKHTYNEENCLYINLLDAIEEDSFSRNPNELIDIVAALPEIITHIIIDEIQKVPKLLDIVHLLLETEKCGKYFILTGSSARKLKTAGVNLLAGRAFVYSLYPFTYRELKDKFDLDKVLQYGLLPGVFDFSTDKERQQFLQAYALTYLKEEIWAEHLVNKLDPFRRFLEVAAQCNGKIINYSNIARDVGVNDKTVKSYFSILEDTLLAVILNPYKNSFRKRFREAPKFYFFDVGVARSLARMLSVKPKPGTSYYGELFESFVIMECVKLASYYNTEFSFSYLMTGAGVEIDLVVERPGQPLLLIEIKSSGQIRSEHLAALQKMAMEIENCEAICLANEKRQKKIGDVMVYPWQSGIAKYFG
ncbi:MAG: ATP-binding protein [Gammaproteobacteria bacterium]|nr:ATP-binding protein [Gammaproteobacteria bacterium]